MRQRVAVVDYAAGNSPSVLRALAHLGIEACAVNEPEELEGATHAVLPGVGSASETMRSLRETGMDEALARHVADGRPYLGICIGLQVLFERSEEDGAECLGWLPGVVRRFPPTVRVPQIGWNLVADNGAPPHLAAALGAHFYFVNSFVAEPANRGLVVAEADYGGPFAAAVLRDNVVATQFHLEKSGPRGLELLRRAIEGAGC